MEITANFESGNILVETVRGSAATLRIRPDSNADFFQWFYFRAEGVAGEERQLSITNAAGASYPGAWPGFRVLTSSDHVTWQRLANALRERRPEFHTYRCAGCGLLRLFRALS